MKVLLLLAVLAALGLSACGGDDSEESSDPAGTSTGAQTTGAEDDSDGDNAAAEDEAASAGPGTATRLFLDAASARDTEEVCASITPTLAQFLEDQKEGGCENKKSDLYALPAMQIDRAKVSADGKQAQVIALAQGDREILFGLQLDEGQWVLASFQRFPVGEEADFG